MNTHNFTPEELQNEDWQLLALFDGYEISTLGRVRSHLTRKPGILRAKTKIIKPRPNKNRYLEVWLYQDGKRYARTLHRLVLETFVGPRPEGLEACHRDDSPNNNRLSNLRWDTRAGNLLDRGITGTLTPFKAQEIRQKYQPFIYTALQLAEEYGVSESMIRKVVKGLRRKDPSVTTPKA